MKKSPFLTLLILSLLIVLVFATCTKEKSISPDSTDELLRDDPDPYEDYITEGDSTGLSCVESITTTCNGTVLVFADLAHYEYVYACLQNSYDVWNDGFELAYSYMNDSVYDLLCDSLEFEEDQPLINFEDYFHFNSYRKHMAGLESYWNNSLGGVDSLDPDDHNIFDDEVMETLFNPDGVIKIGSDFLRVYEDGTNVVISGGSCAQLDSLDNNPNYSAANISRIVYGSNTSGGCSTWKKEKDKDIIGNLKIKYKLSHKSFAIIGTKSLAKTKIYKKKLGIWVGKRAWISAKDSGEIYLVGECDDSIESVYEYKKRRKRTVKARREWSGDVRAVKSTFMWSEHIYDANTLPVPTGKIYTLLITF